MSYLQVCKNLNCLILHMMRISNKSERQFALWKIISAEPYHLTAKNIILRIFHKQFQSLLIYVHIINMVFRGACLSRIGVVSLIVWVSDCLSVTLPTFVLSSYLYPWYLQVDMLSIEPSSHFNLLHCHGVIHCYLLSQAVTSNRK